MKQNNLPAKQPRNFTRTEIVQAGVKHLTAGTRSVFDIGKDLGLTAKQINFSQLYMSLNRNYFGNGVQCAAKAYDVDISTPEGRRVASAYASRALQSDGVKLLCAMLLDREGLNDEAVDKQLAFMIEQNLDMKSKVLAIKEYNALRSRIKHTQEIIHRHVFDYTALTDSELKTFIELAEKAKINDEPRTAFAITN